MTIDSGQAVSIPNVIAPDVGTLFRYGGHGYVVKGWLKRMSPPESPAGERGLFADMLAEILYEAQQQVGPDRARLVFCDRLEAEYVSGGGVCGCVARVADIEITGEAPWSEERFEQVRGHAAAMIGRPVF